MRGIVDANTGRIAEVAQSTTGIRLSLVIRFVLRYVMRYLVDLSAYRFGCQLHKLHSHYVQHSSITALP